MSNNIKKSETIYSVHRGSELMSIGRRMEEIKSLTVDEGDFEDFISLTQNCKIEHNYSKSDHCVSFNVDKKVMIVGVGFLGPRFEVVADYSVKTRIEKLSWSPDGKNVEKINLRSTDKEVHGIRRGEIFTVDFDSPVVIDPSAIKYTIAFKLKGPETDGLDPIKMKTHVRSHEYTDVEFYFWPGSQQMPVIRFQNVL